MNPVQISNIASKLLVSELKDDLNSIKQSNDLTTFSLIKKDSEIQAVFINREKMVLCGEYFLKRFLKKKFPEIKYYSNFKDGDFLKKKFPEIKYYSNFKDGDFLKKKTSIIKISGNVKKIFMLERTLLNFLQHLSSISTHTRLFKNKIKGTNTKILDTRKTTTGLRKLEKYAASIGGANNHRIGLFDKIFIKDNHIKILGGIDNTLTMIKKKKLKGFIIECDTISQVKKCLNNSCNYILLDNMTTNQVKECLNLKKNFKKKIMFEVSGGINLLNIKSYAKLGVDFISTSKITNSAKSVDIGLDIL